MGGKEKAWPRLVRRAKKTEAGRGQAAERRQVATSRRSGEAAVDRVALGSQAPLANRQGWTVPDIVSGARARGLAHLPCLQEVVLQVIRESLILRFWQHGAEGQGQGG